MSVKENSAQVYTCDACKGTKIVLATDPEPAGVHGEVYARTKDGKQSIPVEFFSCSTAPQHLGNAVRNVLGLGKEDLGEPTSSK